MVDNSEDSIFSPYFGQNSNQIHGNLLEWKGVFWGGDTVQGNSRPMCKVLVLLTGCAPGDIVGDPGLHPLPDQMVLGLSEGLISSRVSCGGVIVNQSH